MENIGEHHEIYSTGEEEYVDGLRDAIKWLASSASDLSICPSKAHACIGFLEDYLDHYQNGQWWTYKEDSKLTPGKYVGITNEWKVCILIVAENGTWIYDAVSKLPVKESDVIMIMEIVTHSNSRGSYEYR